MAAPGTPGTTGSQIFVCKAYQVEVLGGEPGEDINRVSRTEWDLDRSARSKVLECSDTIRRLLETLRNYPTSILESYSGCRASVSTI